jgi:hypothetical protein
MTTSEITSQKAANWTEQCYTIDAYIEGADSTKPIVLVTDESDTGIIEIKGVDLMGATAEIFDNWLADVQAFMAESNHLKYFVNQPLTLIK